jgi:hypothetical protein
MTVLRQTQDMIELIKKIFHKAIPLLFFSGAAILSNAQNKTTVKASIDKNKILIGEPIKLSVEVNIPRNEAIRFFTIDSLPHFEFLEKQKIDTSGSGNETVLKQAFKITSFDSGHWVIPSFVLEKNITTDTIPVDVDFSNFDPNQDYHDIKDIIEVNPVEKKNWLWFIISGAILFILIIIWLLSMRKKKVVLPGQPVVNPYEEAIKQLEQLRKQKLPPKQYYSELVDIFRLYIFRKKEILSLQKTTDDLVMQLKDINLDKEQHAPLAQALRLSDFVKFAKYIPANEDDVNVFNIIKNSITTIEQSESKTSP